MLNHIVTSHNNTSGNDITTNGSSSAIGSKVDRCFYTIIWLLAIFITFTPLFLI